VAESAVAAASSGNFLGSVVAALTDVASEISSGTWSASWMAVAAGPGVPDGSVLAVGTDFAVGYLVGAESVAPFLSVVAAEIDVAVRSNVAVGTVVAAGTVDDVGSVVAAGIDVVAGYVADTGHVDVLVHQGSAD